MFQMKCRMLVTATRYQQKGPSVMWHTYYWEDLTVMYSQSTPHDPSDTPPASISADAPDQASANANGSAPSQDNRNPLWIITAAMAIFFAVAAAFLAAG
jgi:hypothetical protein